MSFRLDWSFNTIPSLTRDGVVGVVGMPSCLPTQEMSSCLSLSDEREAWIVSCLWRTSTGHGHCSECSPRLMDMVLRGYMLCKDDRDRSVQLVYMFTRGSCDLHVRNHVIHRYRYNEPWAPYCWNWIMWFSSSIVIRVMWFPSATVYGITWHTVGTSRTTT